mgnify:CR=1 FL=1
MYKLFTLNQHGCGCIVFNFKYAGIPHLAQVIVTIRVAIKYPVTARAQIGRFRSALAFYGITALHLVGILAVRPSNRLGSGAASNQKQQYQKQVFHLFPLS